jgi:superfamily I DNA/RNA helicase
LPDTVEKLSVDDTELTLFPEMAVRTGDRPELIGFENQSDLIRYILDKIIEAKNRLGSYSSICLAFQSSKNISYYNSLLAELKDKKIPFSEIVSKQSKLNFEITKDEVKLMTIHGVKGYEFDTVFLIGLDSLKIPNQERLIFVGITRAANFLYIPFLKTSSDNPYLKKLEDAYIESFI